MKNEFIYSINEIFGTVLAQAKLAQYYIGPYQRGYKWASDNFYDEVPQLLIDVYEAYKNGLEEYYLQYITVLRNAALCSYEVIDGQQRLTTLAIVFDRLSAKTGGDIPSLALGKIEYSRDGADATLFDKIRGVGADGSPLPDTQDLHYISKAAACVDLFAERLAQAGELQGYAKYLAERVKIIFNRESDFVSAEEVFGNLNGNRVELTNSYLIKGLLLTKGINRVDRNGVGLSYFNIVEQRRVNGRLWDEMQNWVEQHDVCYFFFGKDAAQGRKGMERLLELLYAYGLGKSSQQAGSDAKPLLDQFKSDLKKGTQAADNLVGFRLFNQFNELIITDADALECMRRLAHLYKKLRSLYEDAELYNMLGYVLFARNDKGKGKDKDKDQGKAGMVHLLALVDMGQRRIKDYLADEILKALPDASKETLRYDNGNKKKLTPFLLAFSVFPESAAAGYRFDFIAYHSKSWTHEHIRPQNPETGELAIKPHCREPLLQLLARHEDAALLDKVKAAANAPEPDIEAVKALLDADDGRKAKQEQIESLLLQDVDNNFPFLYSDLDEGHLHSMGNMALLSDEVNSSVSNNPYVVKRGEIMNKAEQGSFIPMHTLGAFSKSLNTTKSPDAPQFTADMLAWEAADVDAHAAWMRGRNAEIIANINKLKIKK